MKIDERVSLDEYSKEGAWMSIPKKLYQSRLAFWKRSQDEYSEEILVKKESWLVSKKEVKVSMQKQGYMWELKRKKLGLYSQKWAWMSILKK